jgi:TRAP-type C4-dicarboxylate transport system permease large subunit
VDTKPVLQVPWMSVATLYGCFVEIIFKQPNPTGAVAAELTEAAKHSASVEEILQVNQLFQWLLPGLITNVAFFREQLR